VVALLKLNGEEEGQMEVESWSTGCPSAAAAVLNIEMVSVAVPSIEGRGGGHSSMLCIRW